jgi:hypothetical protein
MTKEQKDSLLFAHSALVDYIHFMRLFQYKLDFEKDINDVIDTVNNLEKQFPFLDIDNQNLN